MTYALSSSDRLVANQESKQSLLSIFLSFRSGEFNTSMNFINHVYTNNG